MVQTTTSRKPHASAQSRPMASSRRPGTPVSQSSPIPTSRPTAGPGVSARPLEIWAAQLFAGVSVASILLLIALGLTFTFGQMNVVNMAHGEFIMVGAYTAYVVQRGLGLQFLAVSILISLVIAFLISGVLG